MIIKDLTKQNLIWFTVVTVFCINILACSYSPEEERGIIKQVVRSGDTYTGYVLVEYKLFRQPTGFLNTFPNGGVPRILSQNVKVYEVHALERKFRMLAELSPDDDIWESFTGHIVGLDDQNNPLVRLRGCEKDGECYPEIASNKYFRFKKDGTFESISELPSNTVQPGVMLARREGEINYVRFSIRANILKAKFDEDGNYESLFVTNQNGNLVNAE
jgi:hypothetical protein